VPRNIFLLWILEQMSTVRGTPHVLLILLSKTVPMDEEALSRRAPYVLPLATSGACDLL